MLSEEGSDGRTRIEDDGPSPADAPGIGTLGAQRPDADRVRTATRHSGVDVDVVAAGVSGCGGAAYRQEHRKAALGPT
jgi:hypothetical protein